MKAQVLEAVGLTAAVFAPDGGGVLPVVYLHAPRGEAEETAALLGDWGGVLVSLEGGDWDRDLSPWPAPRAFRGGADFGGGAGRRLELLGDAVLPAVEGALGYVPPWRGIAGYSLAGLFALYALWTTPLFQRAASVSGSLWYDGFLERLEGTAPAVKPDRVYLSLGDREPKARSPRLARVGECTLRAEERLRELGIPAALEWNPGGHFQDAPGRMARGLGWLAAGLP